ncbi:MAG: cytochrome c family protein [Thermodesulfovibrionia bacterium]|nr:cytochrome c family protein [Thermodesulfovibrionia bacterium]
MLRKAVTLLLSGMLIMVLTSIVSANGPQYVGAKKCKACHLKQYKSWEKTKNAKGFENLKPGVKPEEKKKAKLDPNKDYTTDVECLKCHTTGYGKPGGFKSLAETPDMINAQCETCHGPGSEFTKIMKANKEFKRAEIIAAGWRFPSEPENEKRCLECHGGDSPFNEKVDQKYKWDFKERLKNTHEHFPLKYKH